MPYAHLELLQLSTSTLQTVACSSLCSRSHNTLDYKLVPLLCVISKIHFVRIFYRVAALNKGILYHRKEQKQTNPWALHQTSYCVYHLKLKLNSVKNTFQWNSVCPLPEMQEGLLFSWVSTPIQWLWGFTLDGFVSSVIPRLLLRSINILQWKEFNLHLQRRNKFCSVCSVLNA